MGAKRRVGDVAPEVRLPRADGGAFDSRDLLGRKWLLSFQRYAT
jgi:peroxiredoxin